MAAEEDGVSNHALQIFVPVYFFVSVRRHQLDLIRSLLFVISTVLIWCFYDWHFEYYLGVIVSIYVLDLWMFKTRSTTRNILAVSAYFHRPIIGAVIAIILTGLTLSKKKFLNHHFSHYYMTKSKLDVVENWIGSMPALRIMLAKKAALASFDPASEGNTKMTFAQLVTGFYFGIGQTEGWLSMRCSDAIKAADDIVESLMAKAGPLLKTIDEIQFRKVEVHLRNGVKQAGKNSGYKSYAYTDSTQAHQYYILMMSIYALSENPSNDTLRTKVERIVAPYVTHVQDGQ